MTAKPPAPAARLVRMIVAYDGTRFHGFQRQMDNTNFMLTKVNKRPRFDETNGTKKHCNKSIQEILEQSCLHLYPNVSVQDLNLRFAGRTDKGVHAKGQVIAVYLPASSGWDLCNALNNRLPVDISVHQVQILEPESSENSSFDPRKDAQQKRYSYTIKYRRQSSITNDNSKETTTNPERAGPIRHALDPSCLWRVPWSLNDALLHNLCQELQGTHDYSNFVHKHNRNLKDQNLTIDSMTFQVLDTQEELYDDNNEQLVVCTGRFVVQGQRFRRQMIRNLVGYCVDVCRNHDTVPSMEQAFTPHTETATKINAAPASGLCLEHVTY